MGDGVEDMSNIGAVGDIIIASDGKRYQLIQPSPGSSVNAINEDGDNYIITRSMSNSTLNATATGSTTGSTPVGPSPTNQPGATGGAGGSLTSSSKRSRASAGVASAGGGNSSSSSSSSSAAASSSAGAPAQSSSAQRPGESTAAYLDRRRLGAPIALLPDGSPPMPGSTATPEQKLSWLSWVYAHVAGSMGALSTQLERQMRRANIIEVSGRSPFYRALLGGVESLHYIESPTETYIIANGTVFFKSAVDAAKESIRTAKVRVISLVALMRAFERLQKANHLLTEAQKDTSVLPINRLKELEQNASFAENKYLQHILLFLTKFQENKDAKTASINQIEDNIPAEQKIAAGPKIFPDLAREASQEETSGVVSASSMLNSKAVIALLQAANDAESVEGNRPVELLLKRLVEGGFPFPIVQKVPKISDVNAANLEIIKFSVSRGIFEASYGGEYATLLSRGLLRPSKKTAQANSSGAKVAVSTAATDVQLSRAATKAVLGSSAELPVASSGGNSSSSSSAAVSSAEAEAGAVSSAEGEGTEAEAEAVRIGQVPGLNEAIEEEAAAGGGSSAAGGGLSQMVPDQFEGLGGGARRTRIRKNRKSQKKARKVKKQVRKTRHHKKRSTRRR